MLRETDGVQLHVRDSGTGRPEGEAECIFQLFGRATRPRAAYRAWVSGCNKPEECRGARRPGVGGERGPGTRHDGLAAARELGDVRVRSAHRVLAIDDEVAIRAALEDILPDEAHEVRTAGDGRQGLEILAGWTPDVILLDLTMPVMGGSAFREAQLEMSGEAREVPIVLLTGGRDAEAQARRMGAEAVLVKPFDIDDLLAVIDRVLKSGARR